MGVPVASVIEPAPDDVSVTAAPWRTVPEASATAAHTRLTVFTSSTSLGCHAPAPELCDRLVRLASHAAASVWPGGLSSLVPPSCGRRSMASLAGWPAARAAPAGPARLHRTITAEARQTSRGARTVGAS